MAEKAQGAWVVLAVGEQAAAAPEAVAARLAAAPERRPWLVASPPVVAAVTAVVTAAGGAAPRKVDPASAPGTGGGWEASAVAGEPGVEAVAAAGAVGRGAAEVELWIPSAGFFTADPARVPAARRLERLGWGEARELAGLEGGPFDPRALRPLAEAGIPLRLWGPSGEETLIAASPDEAPVVTALVARPGVTLVTLRSWSMWRSPGFLARFFAPFAAHGLSVDLVATSEAAVSVTLDRLPGGLEGEPFQRLVADLAPLGRVGVVHPCAVVSIVGRRIRSVLHEIGPALAAFREWPVHLVSDSSEDVDLSFVLDEEDVAALLGRLHEDLFGARVAALPPPAAAAAPPGDAWWRRRRGELLARVADGRPRYVYHPAAAAAQARRLRRELPAAGRLYYALKANPHPALVAAVVGEGFGLECVSAAEVARARELAGPAVPLLFTPNFCPVSEYGAAFAAGAEVVVDGAEVLAAAPEVFRGRTVGLRVDPGRGLGHHEKVHTAGAQAKFGTPLDEVAAFAAAAATAGVRVNGLHAHPGSGILDPAAWGGTGRLLAGLVPLFPGLAWLDLGGGLGVPQRPGDAPLDLAALGAVLDAVAAGLRTGRGAAPELRLEPGRFLVSAAGVLVAPVTQVRRRGGLWFAGVATGMNSLLRPALYGAWHTIHNLTRLDEPATERYHVVGPLCESSDVLGRDRRLPRTRPGDVLLIENAGAYGAVMSSRYNLREPAAEEILE